MTSKTQDIALDKALVDRFKSGDETAFSQVISRYWDRIYYRVLQMLKNQQDAEEVTQDTFIRAHRALEKFRGEASLSTWLYQIATNLAHNRYWYWWRRKRHASIALDQPLSEDEDSLSLIDVLPSSEEEPRDLAVTQELVDSIAECLPNISEKLCEALTLRIQDNLSYEEIAQKLQISVGTVKSRIARAREQLRQQLDFQ